MVSGIGGSASDSAASVGCLHDRGTRSSVLLCFLHRRLSAAALDDASVPGPLLRTRQRLTIHPPNLGLLGRLFLARVPSTRCCGHRRC